MSCSIGCPVGLNFPFRTPCTLQLTLWGVRLRLFHLFGHPVRYNLFPGVSVCALFNFSDTLYATTCSLGCPFASFSSFWTTCTLQLVSWGVRLRPFPLFGQPVRCNLLSGVSTQKNTSPYYQLYIDIVNKWINCLDSSKRY